MRTITNWLVILTLIVNGASCVAPDMNRSANRRIQVIDSDKDRPVRGLPLVYNEFSPYGIIVREVLTSGPYYTDAHGYANVPSGVTMLPGPGSRYVADQRKDVGKTIEQIHSNDVLYVRTLEKHIATIRTNSEQGAAPNGP